MPTRIELEALTLEEATGQAIRQGYTVLSCRRAGLGLAGLLPASTRRTRFDTLVFVEQLHDLLVAGLSVVEALDALRRGATDKDRVVVERLERALRTGEALSGALAEQAVFPSLLIALVRASELTSDLSQALARFLEHERKAAEVRHRVASVSIYPALLMAVGSLVLLFLFFYVMPRFARVFDGMHGDLPWSARAMLAWASVLREHTAAVTLGFAALIVAVVALGASRNMRSRFSSQLLAWGPLHTRLRTYFLARWYRATGMLVSGGIPLADALRLSVTLLPLALHVSGQRVEASVRDGLSPSAAHASAGMATPVAEQLMRAGERTGDLGAVLTRIARFHESEVTRELERTMRAIEPIVMVAIGLAVGLVVVLMYLPIFELAAAIQ